MYIYFNRADFSSSHHAFLAFQAALTHYGSRILLLHTGTGQRYREPEIIAASTIIKGRRRPEADILKIWSIIKDLQSPSANTSSSRTTGKTGRT